MLEADVLSKEFSSTLFCPLIRNSDSENKNAAKQNSQITMGPITKFHFSIPFCFTNKKGPAKFGKARCIER